MGTLMAVPIALLTRGWRPEAFFGLFLCIFFAGWWASLGWSRQAKEPDSQKIVIDEVLGYLVAVGTFPRTPAILFVQFLLFRLFDVLKPPPIRQLDRFGKRFPIGAWQSLGVIMDDLIAGLFAWGVLFLILRFSPLSIRLALSG